MDLIITLLLLIFSAQCVLLWRVHKALKQMQQIVKAIANRPIVFVQNQPESNQIH